MTDSTDTNKGKLRTTFANVSENLQGFSIQWERTVPPRDRWQCLRTSVVFTAAGRVLLAPGGAVWVAADVLPDPRQPPHKELSGQKCQE